MSQSTMGNMESPLSGTDFINAKLEPAIAAIYSNHSGTSRPSYVAAGMIWLNTNATPWILNIFDGTDDIAIGTVNATTNIFTPAGLTASLYVGGTVGGSANSLTFTATPTLTAYNLNNIYTAVITTTNTSGTVVINIDGAGSKSVKKYIGGAKVVLAVGDLQAGVAAMFQYDGTDVILMNPRPNSKGATVASSGTTNLDTTTGNYVQISGTTTITAITLQEGRQVLTRFDGILTLTHGASLVLPTAANITTAAGDFALWTADASGVTRCVFYQRANGQALAASASSGWLSNMEANLYYYDDFIGKAVGANYITVFSGAGAAVGGGSNSNRVNPTTGTTTTGSASVGVSLLEPLTTYKNGFTLEMRASLLDMSDGTNRFTARFGARDPNSSTDTDGMYFRYADNVNGGNLQCVSRNGGVETVINTGVTMLENTSTPFYLQDNYKIVLGASSVEFFKNGTSLGTISTNLPAGSLNLWGASIVKSLGTATKALYVGSIRAIAPY